MHSNLENFKRKMTNLVRSGKRPTTGSLESPTNDEEKSSAIVAYEAARINQLREQSKGLPLNNPHKEKEILDSIDPTYYSENGFDPSAYELTRLPSVINVNEITAERKRKRNQLLVVTKKVSDLILHNHPSYSAELNKVTQLQNTLSSAHSACRSARKMIDGARENFTVAGITILGKYRKLQRLLAVLEAMKRLKTLKETDQRLRELFEEENYVGAIMMCAECQRAAAAFRQYRCISDLAIKLHDTMVKIEQQLENALASMTLRIDLERYSKVIAAYEMIGKMKVAADATVAHFSRAIVNAVDSIVETYCGNVASAEIPTTNGIVDETNSKNVVVPAAVFVECLREILSIFWRIWLGYHTLFLWHVERPVLTPHGRDTEGPSDGDYVETTFEQGLSKLWLDSIKQLSQLIRNTDLNGLKMDDFFALINLSNQVSIIGRRHFKSKSIDLEDVLRDKSVEYFRYHHQHSLDELAMFLEMEAWEPVPVNRHFSYKDLPEFAFLVSSYSNFDAVIKSDSGIHEDPNRPLTWEFLTEANSSKNPFEFDDTLTEPVTFGQAAQDSESDDSDVPDELKRDFIDDTAGENNVQRPVFKRNESFKPMDSMQPILSNVALTMLRSWGRFLQAAHCLPSVAFEVVVLLAQLFDYFFLVIYRYFGSDAIDFGVNYKSVVLSGALQRIERALPEIGKDIPHNRAAGSMLDMADSLFGLAPRIVAVESLIFVAKQLESLRPFLENLVSSEKIAFVRSFYSQTVNVIPELRHAVYGAVSSKALDYGRFVESLAAVNWEINELMSQHSEYVGILARDLDNLRLRLDELSRTVRIPKETCVILWELCIQIIAKLLVEGYSSTNKCSNEGRALMQLDFQQLLLITEKISNLRPLPYREYVENYIKAYYLPEREIAEWVMERKDYSPKQLIGLLNMATHVSRKTRQRLTISLLGNPAAGAAEDS